MGSLSTPSTKLLPTTTTTTTAAAAAVATGDGLVRTKDDDTIETGTGGHYIRYSDDDNNNKNTNDDDNNDNNNNSISSTWAITNFGNVGKYSRDGSVHATDEVFNTGSHVFATLLSLLGSVLLITQSANPTYGPVSAWKIVSFSIYGISLIFLFTCSSLHHGISGQGEYMFRVMDYLAIYPLIAGTFTPLCLVFYHNDAIGWIFCSTVWFIAICGMICTAIWFTKIPKWLSMTLYITLGWFGACMSYWLIPKLTLSGFILFIFGGILYTIGGYVYSAEVPNPYPGRFGFHEIWHITVVLAATCHWLMMWCYVLPYNDGTISNINDDTY